MMLNKSNIIYRLLFFALFISLSLPVASASVSWTGSGNGISWADPLNWSANAVPNQDDDITIDCSCTITVGINLIIDGMLSIAEGTTLDMQNNDLEIGANSNNASLTNEGSIDNCTKFKAKGDGNVPEGPFISNFGIITAQTFQIGNNNGGGMANNYSGAMINVTNTIPAGPDGIDESLHVDGTLCNEGVINVTLGATFHGAILKCGGTINASTIEFEQGKGLPSGGGATGGASDIQSQSFSDGSGCSGSSSAALKYYVIGGTDGGPNGDDSYTFEQLLIEFGTTDTNPDPQFKIDPDLVTSCEKTADITAPVFTTFPTNTTAYLTENSCNLKVEWDEPLVADDQEMGNVTSSAASGDLFSEGPNTITYTAEDAAGNISEKSFIIQVLDTITPKLTFLPSDIIQSSDPADCGATINWTLPVFSDNCSFTITSSHNPGDYFAVGTTRVIYTATDEQGNSKNTGFNVIVTDEISPDISGIPANISQSADSDACGAIVSWSLPTATDNCNLSSLTSTHNPGDLFPVGTTTVTYTATDEQGNTEEQSFDIIITDDISPVISGIPANISQSADSDACGAIVSWPLPTATDNCNLSSLTSTHNPGDLFPVGTTTVTYTATDEQGNTDTRSFDITIADHIAPVFSNIPTNITQPADAGACGALVSWAAPIVSDNCGATFTSSHKPGDFFEIGVTVVSYTAIDTYGNQESASFTITIDGHNTLEFTNCTSTYLIESIDTVQKFATISWEVPQLNNQCSDVTLTSNFEPGQIFDYGTFTVTYTAKDKNGNEATCSFDVSSGYNRSPMVRNSARKATAGETLVIVIDAFDPDGHQLSIKSIHNNSNNSFISSIGYQSLTFEYTAFEYFSGSDTVNVVITDNGTPSSTVEAQFIFQIENRATVEVASAITTNGDMINDQWQLTNIEYYPNNSVYVYDRWGGLIYQDNGYDNQSVFWSGNTRRSKREFVPSGTYFYVINLGDGYGKLTGAVEVIQ